MYTWSHLCLCIYHDVIAGTIDTPSLNDRMKAQGDYEKVTLIHRVAMCRWYYSYNCTK